MPTTPGQVSRVLGALEDLASQEELLVHAEDYAEVAAVQMRMAPLVYFLVEEEAAADVALRERIVSFVARRDRTQQRLATEVKKMREEMVQLEASRRRIARVAPAYSLRSAAAATSRLSARSSAQRPLTFERRSYRWEESVRGFRTYRRTTQRDAQRLAPSRPDVTNGQRSRD